MSFLLILGVSALMLAAVGVALWLIWQTVRDQAAVRRSLDVVMLRVLLPKDIDPEEREEGIGADIKERIAVAEQWLTTLSRLRASWWDRFLYGPPVFVLEIVARQDGIITFYAGCERRFIDHLEKQIYAFYPEAEVERAQDFTIFDTADTVRLGWFTLARSAHLPLATYAELNVDPLQAITGALAKIRATDAALIQLVCQPASGRTRRRARRAAERTVKGKQKDVGSRGSRAGLKTATPSPKGGAEDTLTPRAQERIELVERKHTESQFTVNLRLGVSIREAEEADKVFNALTAVFAQYEQPDLNALRLRTPRRAVAALADLVWRVPRPRQSITLGTAELTSLFHFPLPTTSTPRIAWRGAKTAPAPAQLPGEGTLLGRNIYRGIQQLIYWQPEDRRRHLYAIGQTGTGKSTLFLNLIRQDITAGRGVGVVDPHGDLIEDILRHIPPEREDDVILFDPHDTQRPLGFNILETSDDNQRDLIVNEVVNILQKLAARLNPESIGPMFEHYLRNALLALGADPAATLLDVPRLFVDGEFRSAILSHVTDPTVRQFWEKEFVQSQRGQLSADMLSYVISKLGRFISNAVIRNIIGQPESSFDVREVMDQQKILLCNLSKGMLGDINADLLGFVLVSKIQVAALGRANVPAAQRPDFYLYLDEFQNFTTDSIATMLSEARKYHLNLNITHQFIDQLGDEIREAVFGNVGTLISLRVGVEDAAVLAPQFSPVFSEYDLVNLERFTACLRLLVSGTPQRAMSLQIDPPAPPLPGSDPERVRQRSRERYGRARAEVEERILERFQAGRSSANSPPTGPYLGESLFDVQ
jgi:hypothetical protein